MTNAIEMKNLSKKYHQFTLNNVTLSVPQGSIMGMIGENGAGKTTTIKLILNEISRDSGIIKILGLDNQKDEKNVKEQIGVVFDECYFHQDFTPKNVSKILSRVYKSWNDQLYWDYIGKFRLESNKKIKEFSKGMKMKLSIASALAHNPKLLILDEATSGLDPVMRSDILDILRDFIQNEENSILFSSHITSDLEHVADYITFLHEGKIVFTRPKDELTESYGILKCSSSDLVQFDSHDLLRVRKNNFGCEVLVLNRARLHTKYRNFVIDAASLEDIMLFYVKGETI